MTGVCEQHFKNVNRLMFLVFFTFITITSFSSKSYGQNCTVNAGIDETICETETLTLQGVLGGAIDSSLWVQTGGTAACQVLPRLDAVIPTNGIGTSIKGFEDFNQKLESQKIIELPNGLRIGKFTTDIGKAKFTVNKMSRIQLEKRGAVDDDHQEPRSVKYHYLWHGRSL